MWHPPWRNLKRQQPLTPALLPPPGSETADSESATETDCDALPSVLLRTRCRAQGNSTTSSDPSSTPPQRTSPPANAVSAPRTMGTVFKKRNEQSSALSAEEMCFLPAGRHTLSRQPEIRFNEGANVTSHFVALAARPQGCSFSEGYLATGHVSGVSESWVRPVSSSFHITSDFNKIRSCGSCSTPHQGIDYGTPQGTPVLATAQGVLNYTETNQSLGRVLLVYHNVQRNGRTLRITSRYAHNSRFELSLQHGSAVKAGTTIAYSGNTGLSTGPHLHFDMFDRHDRYPPRGTCRIDPHALSSVYGPREQGIRRSPNGICQL